MADDMITCELHDDMDERLGAFEGLIVRVILKEALLAAGLVLKDALIQHAPERTDDKKSGTSLPAGALRMDIGGDVKIFPERGRGVLLVGPSDLTAHVARFLEYGHDVRRHGALFMSSKGKVKHHKSGTVIGHVPPKKFIVPAFDESFDQALDAFYAKLKEGVEQMEQHRLSAGSDEVEPKMLGAGSGEADQNGSH
jgi:hypothetical protein